jgi:hypothetical protein
LEKDDFLLVTPARVTIYWGQKTKSSRTDPSKEYLFTVLEGDLVPEIAAQVALLPPKTPLCTTTTAQMTSILREEFGSDFSSHSFKCGAVTFLLGEVAAGKLELPMVSRLAKHAATKTTIAYGRNLGVNALALGTANATKLL